MHMLRNPYDASLDRFTDKAPNRTRCLWFIDKGHCKLIQRLKELNSLKLYAGPGLAFNVKADRTYKMSVKYRNVLIIKEILLKKN